MVSDTIPTLPEHPSTTPLHQYHFIIIFILKYHNHRHPHHHPQSKITHTNALMISQLKTSTTDIKLLTLGTITLLNCRSVEIEHETDLAISDL